MRYCSANGCRNGSNALKNKKYVRENNITFHGFPLKDEQRLGLWLARLGRDNFTPSIHSCLCSIHFHEDDFTYQPFTGIRMLKKTAVPSKFYSNNNNDIELLQKHYEHLSNHSSETEAQQVQMQLNPSCFTMDPGQDEADVNHVVFSLKSTCSKRKRKRRQVRDETEKNEESPSMEMRANRSTEKKLRLSCDPGCSESCPSVSLVHPVKLFRTQDVQISQAWSDSIANSSLTDLLGQSNPNTSLTPVADLDKSRDTHGPIKHTGQEVQCDFPYASSVQDILRRSRKSQLSPNKLKKPSQSTAGAVKLSYSSLLKTWTDLPLKQNTCSTGGQMFQWEHQLSRVTEQDHSSSTEHKLSHKSEQSLPYSLDVEYWLSHRREPNLTSTVELESALSHQVGEDPSYIVEGRLSPATEQDLLSILANSNLHRLEQSSQSTSSISSGLSHRTQQNLSPAVEQRSVHETEQNPCSSVENRLTYKGFSPPPRPGDQVLSHQAHSKSNLPGKPTNNDTSSSNYDVVLLNKTSMLNHTASSSTSKYAGRYNKNYDCRFCGKVFKQQLRLRSHIYRVHENHGSLDVLTDKLQFVCTLCKKSFKSLKWLEAHLEKHKAGDYHNACPDCGKVFPILSMLKNHQQQVHTDNRKFVCKQCGKAYKYLKNLQDHKLIHLGIKKHLCEICGKELSTIDGLRGHMRSHEGPAPFKCDICGKSYFLPFNLRHHMVSKHRLTEAEQVKTGS